MKRLQTCEACPATSDTVERFQKWIDTYYKQYTDAGEGLLTRLLDSSGDEYPDGSTLPASQQSSSQNRHFTKAARNISLSIMYLSQLESGIDYVNSLPCEVVEHPEDCPRLSGIMSIAALIQESMLEDVRDLGQPD